VRPSHLLDKNLWKKLGLEVAREETESEAGKLLTLLRGPQAPAPPAASSR
jgi:hypothetical protein